MFNFPQSESLTSFHIQNFENLLSNLEKTTLKPNLNLKNRKILIEWLISIHSKFNLFPSSLFLAINLFDKISTIHKIEKKFYQLNITTCFFIASKIDDIYPPSLKNLEYVSAGSCKKEDILCKEVQICTEMNWKILPSDFWRICCLLKEIAFRRIWYFKNNKNDIKETINENKKVKKGLVDITNIKPQIEISENHIHDKESKSSIKININ